MTWYLDESATDGGTPIAVVGGLLLSEDRFDAMNAAWQSMLLEFGLPEGLHMKEFGKHGRLKDLETSVKTEIFSLASAIIRNNCIYSMEAVVRAEDHREFFLKNPKTDLTIYELCFVACVIGNNKLAEENGYSGEIAFIMDKGNPYSRYVVKTHSDMKTIQEQHGPINIGALDFRDDEELSALQAADVICWGARRRKASDDKFPSGLEPISEILHSPTHIPVQVPRDAMRLFAEQMNSNREAKP